MSILPLFFLGSALVFIGIFVLTSGSSGMSSVLMMTGCTYGEEEERKIEREKERREEGRRRGEGEGEGGEVVEGRKGYGKEEEREREEIGRRRGSGGRQGEGEEEERER